MPPSNLPSTLRRYVATAARAAEVNTAVAFAVLTKVWQIFSTLVTMLLIVRYLTPEAQGFFYTFASLLGLQSFFELAFYLVIINAASHEWAHLALGSDGRIVGAPDALSRLVSLGRLSAKWYAASSLLFLVGVGVAGLWFFNSGDRAAVDWRAPWIALVCCASLLLFALPFNSILEGCNQVAELQRFRFCQVAVASIALWTALASGLGLWGAVASSAAMLVCNAALIFGRYRRFFQSFLTPPAGPRLDWGTHIWPMQWRLALSGVVSFLAVSLFNPVMFRYHGAVVAGQMGMTWAMAGGVQAIGLAWISTRVPLFGQLIAKREWAVLDALWWRTSAIAVAVTALGGVAAFGLVAALYGFDVPFAARLLPPLPTALFLTGTVLMQVSQCQSAYLRAHRQEPIVWMSFTCSALTGAGVWLLGSRIGPMGAAATYLGVSVLTVVWETAIWRRCRRDWHRDA